jgi:hypothetical protein
MNRKARQRAYQVQMAVLAEEARIMKLSAAEVTARSREIYASCFEDDDRETTAK